MKKWYQSFWTNILFDCFLQNVELTAFPENVEAIIHCLKPLTIQTRFREVHIIDHIKNNDIVGIYLELFAYKSLEGIYVMDNIYENGQENRMNLWVEYYPL